jgi:hypothetical protein
MADQIANPSLHGFRDRANQQAEKVQRAIQEQTDAINDHTAAIPALQEQPDAHRTMPPPATTTAPINGDSSPSH